MPVENQKPQQKPASLPITPASKSPWLGGNNSPQPGECVLIPEGRPDLIVYIRTHSGYVRAMEIDRDGDSLFGAGPIAVDLTEILADAISKRVSAKCEVPEVQVPAEITAGLRTIQEAIEARKKTDELASIVLAIVVAVALLSAVAYLLIGRRTKGH